MAVEQKNWPKAGVYASNLSELCLSLGQIRKAQLVGEKSVGYADQSNDLNQRAGKRTTYGYALFHAGKVLEATREFQEAEELFKRSSPEITFLDSLMGFRYCDLLLFRSERACWREILKLEVDDEAILVETCRKVAGRAAATRETALKANWLMDVGLDFLTEARAELYSALLAEKDRQRAKPLLEKSLEYLRSSGRNDYIPKTFLTNSLFFHAIGDSGEADRSLLNAQQIAERGPMPLYLADVHLHRARLFRDKGELAKAAQLIRDLGYGRRYDELADAEEAAKAW